MQKAGSVPRLPGITHEITAATGGTGEVSSNHALRLGEGQPLPGGDIPGAANTGIAVTALR